MERAPSPPSLLVIADDLTGANDVGVQFASQGIPSVVLTQPEANPWPPGYEVVVVNTESRHCTPALAADRVRRAAHSGLAAGVRYFFKKTDSTLRGNIGAELEALLAATGESALAFVPAFPEMGRTTRGDIHYVDGAPIAETAFRNDPLSPVRHSSVAEVLRQQTTIPIQSGSHGAVNDWTGCLVLDCESRDEMRSIAQWLAQNKRLRVLAGSAAMAAELPGVIELHRGNHGKFMARGPILLVNGSLNPRSLEQVTAATAEYQRLQMTPEMLVNGESREKFLIEAAKCIGGDVLLFSVRNRDEYQEYLEKARQFGIKDSEIHLVVANVIGRIVHALLERGRFGTLVVFGGDTLMGIARACGWTAFVPRTEVSAGITVATPLGRDLTVISKAGGFGGPDVIAAITDWITSRTPATV